MTHDQRKLYNLITRPTFDLQVVRHCKHNADWITANTGYNL